MHSCLVDDTVRRPAAGRTGEPARVTRTARRLALRLGRSKCLLTCMNTL
jgi:hypothetical protein